MASKKEFTLGDVIRHHLVSPGAKAENELEVRFSTKAKDKLTKIDFDNVIRKLKASGYNSTNAMGDYTLKIQGEFTDVKTGRTRMSNLRTEIRGLSSIQRYCKTNSIDKEIEGSTDYMIKSFAKIGDDTVFPIDNEDYQFRISYQKEQLLTPKMPMVRQLMSEWGNTRKNYRYINRVSFFHPNIPIRVDMSVVKMSVNERQYNIQDSGVFGAIERYEIEIEVLNYGFRHEENIDDTIQSLEKNIKKSIKTILSGLQGTNYPVSVNERNELKKEYYKLLFGREKERLLPRDFCGPASYTLELKNIQPLQEDMTVPNIRTNYTVTDKADGTRKLMFINEKGRIYFLTTNMDVEFTGIVTKNEDLFLSMLDGEHILHDKRGNYMNTYAAFDIYYQNGDSVREKAFVPIKPDELPSNYRLPLLNEFVRTLTKNIALVSGKPASMVIQAKTFYIGTPEKPIFGGCNTILQKEKDGLFPYETDGLIFTPAEFGVGGNKPGEASRPVKVTWEHSFKWKPPEFNTIDFLVSIKRNKSGEQIIGNIFKNGTDTASMDQILQYKILTLRCGFDPAKHGYLNPCQDVLEDRFPAPEGKDDNEGYQPVPFYPTNPYDNKAHICHLVMENDTTGTPQLICQNGDIIEDQAIVEFSYDMSREDKEYRWKPLRVRFDKTAELKAGQKNYGNAYHVANGNWHSIHAPVTAQMISTGAGIPEDSSDDVYYNRNIERKFTRQLRHFHNIGVKKRLISSVSKRGDTLIDFTVGKAGDLSKWTSAHLSFVFGTDISRDNIENKHDGACARFLKARRDNRSVPYCLFVNGNSSLNIRSGLALFTEKGKEITQSVFAEIPKNEALGPAVARQYGKGSKGFDVGSCQFAFHYFCENRDTFQGMLRNVSECIAEGGYFIGTCYDGKKVFDALKDRKKGEGLVVRDRDDKVWEIVKEYSRETFVDDETSLGYAINVYQETINKYFREYLVNFDYLVRAIENYGFVPVSDEEAREMGLPSGIGNFKQLYEAKYRMTADEKYISYFNNYFVFKKIRTVDAEKVRLGETDQSQFEVKLNVADTEKLRGKPTKKKKKLVIRGK